MIATSVAVGILVFLTHWAAPLLAPIFLGLIVAALATPLFSRFVGAGRSETVAMLITVVVLVIAVGTIALLAIYSGRQLTESLALYADGPILRYPDASDLLESIGVAGGLGDVIPPEVLVSTLSTAAAVLAEVGGNLAFALVLAALLLGGPRLARLVGSGLGSEIDCSNGVKYEVKGKITDHQYEFERDGNQVASVSEKWFRVRDSYGIEIGPNEDVGLLLASTVALDQMTHDQG